MHSKSPGEYDVFCEIDLEGMFNVLVHCVLQGTSLCFYSILAQGLSFVRIHFSFLSAQPTVFFWTSVAGIDTDQLRFSCHADIFRVSCFFGLIHRHRAVPGGMDGATVSVLSLEQLITALLLIVNELCHRFRIPLSSASSVPLQTTPDLENPSGSPIPERGSCGAKCRWCDLPCGRAKPGHTGHSCYTHRHWRDG